MLDIGVVVERRKREETREFRTKNKERKGKMCSNVSMDAHVHVH